MIVRIDDSQMQRAITRLLEETKREHSVVLREQARGIVRRIIDLTPPANGKTKGGAAKKAGEATLRADIFKVFLPVKAGTAEHVPIAAEHARWRGPNGRVRRGLAVDEKIRVNRNQLAEYLRQELRKVGWLAAGWNAAALALRVPIPAWISRHGTGHSTSSIKATASSIEIIMTNGTKFAGRARDLERRVKLAVQTQAAALLRRMEHSTNKAAKSSGFK